MNRTDQQLNTVLEAAHQLPLKLQRQLVERLIETAASDESTTVVYLQRLSLKQRSRLAELLDKNSEGRLSLKERVELKRLGSKVDQMLLSNSQALGKCSD